MEVRAERPVRLSGALGAGGPGLSGRVTGPRLTDIPLGEEKDKELSGHQGACAQARKSHALPFSPVDEVLRDPWDRSFARSRRGLHHVIPEGASHF